MIFPSQIFLNDINHVYRTASLQKKFFVPASILFGSGFLCYYEKVRSTMRSAIASYLLKYIYYFSAAELNNIDSEGEVFAEEFSYDESGYGDTDDEDI